MTDSPRRTKILVTLGPSTDRPGVLDALLECGADAARLNMSHGAHADHVRRASDLRVRAGRLGRHVPVIVDLSGPKVRVGDVPPGGIQLDPGSEVRLVPRPVAVPGHAGGVVEVPVPVPGMLRLARKGDAFLIDDGLIRLRVFGRSGDSVRCTVEEGGRLGSRKGIVLPGAALPFPALTAKDRRDIAFGASLGADFFALSFVRSASDLRQAARLAGGIPVLAKIERPEALDDIEGIIRGCAGVIVARGDLGVEVAPERVPLLQKKILRAANLRGRIAIVATQMLASMERSPIPTRAEATDVANAVLDGADGLLLTGETAAGLHPVEAVRVLGRIVDEVERSDLYLDMVAPAVEAAAEPEEALAAAAAEAARELDLGALVVISNTGRTAALLSDHRPHVPIVGVARDAQAARRLALQWGVVPAVGGRGVTATGAAAIATRLLGL
ncbi:MAG: pyruvate kinase, partial [Myxococcota bacterium]|nr:pyruvate kinase [Myxococcota bacterium]